MQELIATEGKCYDAAHRPGVTPFGLPLDRARAQRFRLVPRGVCWLGTGPLSLGLVSRVFFFLGNSESPRRAGALRLLDANLARLKLNIYTFVYQCACSTGPGQSEETGFPPVLTHKVARSGKWVSENDCSRQFGE